MSTRKHTGVFERPADSGIWWIDYRTPDGKRHREKIGSKQLAIDVYRQRKTEIFENRYKPAQPVKMTFSELCKKALEAKRGHLAPLSYASDVQRLRKMEETLGALLIDKITTLDIESLLAGIQREASGPTANRYRAALSSVFTYAVRHKLLLENPVRSVPAYKESEGRIRYLDKDEEVVLRRVIRKLCPEREAEFDLTLHTGLRKGEWFSLQWVNVELEGPQPHLTVEGEMTENGTYCKTGRRTIPLNPTAKGALVALHARSEGSPRVCLARAYWRAVAWFDETVVAAGIEDFTWHDLRHTFGSRCAMGGVPVRTIQKWMGHKSITTTMRYMHLAPSHEWAEIQKLVDTTEDTSKTRISQITDVQEVAR
jgi:integrase